MFSRITKVITEYKELRYLAYHDSLTGLLNRNWLYKNINNLDYKYVYFIDINNLHEINKQGHTIGDRYIQVIVSLISLCINKSDILLRYAGDEFILFSNKFNIIQSDEFYSVGVSLFDKANIMKSIQIADMNMLKNKKSW